MDAIRYKDQVMEFLKVMYPTGLPDESTNTVALRWDSKEFVFRFDPIDFKRKTKKKAVKGRAKKKSFEEQLTEDDVKWLKKLDINVKEQPK
jgi:hypothetical protein